MKQWMQPELLVLGVENTTHNRYPGKRLGWGDDKYVGDLNPREWFEETS